MLAKVKKIVAIVLLGVVLAQTIVAGTASAVGPTCSEYGPLGMPTWFRGLVDANCEVQWPSGDDTNGLKSFITKVLLNISDMVARLIGVASALFIIYGGFKYMLAQGESSQVVGAKKTITNAIIGLVISLLSVVIVNFAFDFFK